ncbi:MAG: putative metal-binding motif-containing protein, partial [Alphaproteobacteria bacterium]|nr:putative metal-binding motif-containing protein [Alphaproteobacteria bacterium]
MPSARHLLLAAVLAVLSLAPRAAHADACDVNRGVLGCQNTLTPTKINNDLWASITSLFDTERYGCRPGSDYGEGQDAWLFSCVYTGRVRIDMIQNDCDIDLFLLKDGCGQGNCLKGSWNGSNSFEHVEFQCQQGSIYYVALERVDNDVWPWQDCTIWGSFKYTLKISCFEECEDGFDNDLDGKIDCLDPDCPVCFERCDDLRDNDFDGLVDCNDPDCRSAATCCDKDSDGYLSMDGLCAGIDCNDTKGSGSLIFPGAAETIADGVDQDCDGFEICYIDNDGDGFGQEVTTKSLIFTCQGPGVAPVAGDCDDLNPEVYPFRPEIPINGIDDNCDLLEDCYNDGDGDGFGADFIKQSPDLTCTQGNVADNNDDC